MPLSPEMKAKFAAFSVCGLRHTVCLSPAQETLQPVREISAASGALIRFKDRVFVVTAAHHYTQEREQAGQQILFAPSHNTGEGVPFGTPLERPKGPIVGRSKPLKPLSVHRVTARFVDLASIEIDSREIPATAEPCELDPASVEPARTGRFVLITGWPQALSQIGISGPAEGILASVPADIGSQIDFEPNPEEWEYKESPAWPQCFFRRVHFRICYDEKRIEGIDKMPPFGLSGCGVWGWRKFKKPEFWLPRLYLVGIQSAYHKGKKALRATRASEVVKLLMEHTAKYPG